VFSFWGRFFLYLILGFVFLVVSVYIYWVIQYYGSGASLTDALLWFRDPELHSFVIYTISISLGAFAVGVLASVVFFLKEMGELSRYEGLEEKINEAQEKLSSLRSKETELRRKVGELQGREKELSSRVVSLERQREVLSKRIGELQKEISNLEEKIEREINDRWEREYQSLLTELRSLRAQKSALVDLFNREKELRECFKKVTGMKLLQFLNAAKKRQRES